MREFLHRTKSKICATNGKFTVVVIHFKKNLLLLIRFLYYEGQFVFSWENKKFANNYTYDVSPQSDILHFSCLN